MDVNEGQIEASLVSALKSIDLELDFDPDTKEVKIIAEDLVKGILPTVVEEIRQRMDDGRKMITPPVREEKRPRKKVALGERLRAAFDAGFEVSDRETNGATHRESDDEMADNTNNWLQTQFDEWIVEQREAAERKASEQEE